MSLFKDISVLNSKSSHVAIKNHDGKFLTYQELYDMSNKFSRLFENHVKALNQCIGLYFQQNLYLPSCILR